MAALAWLIPAPLILGVFVLLFWGKRLGTVAGWFATAMMTLSFAAACGVFAAVVSLPEEQRQVVSHLFTWMKIGSFEVSLDFLADPLSAAMCLFITGVASLIHLYSIGYMRGDARFPRFFLYLNLFAASMVTLVLGANMLVTFLGWEGVGVCSYLLISFWFESPANAAAGKKAFVTNRIGDFGFMIASFVVFATVGSLNYIDLNAAAHGGAIAAGTATAIALLLLLGAMGKSAQLPLYVWLPDAMAGPTPVSALIHAATMVTSGVYLLVRVSPLLQQAGWANDVIAWVGVATALFAATVAVAQNDIKKVLAYSTVSQLGFMFLAIGTGNYVAAIFHVVTHAFFKALLFLGSGSVILGMEHEQDMRKMGGLRKLMPITAMTFIIGWLAIAGVPPFAGFWSKDEILSGAFNHGTSGKIMWVLGLAAALLTAFYMTRQVLMTFFGPNRWREDAHVDLEHEAGHVDDDHGHHLTPDHEPRESPWTMTLPLVVLSVFAIGAGAMNLPFADSTKKLEHWLEPVIAEGHHEIAGGTIALLAVLATVIALIGIAIAFVIYATPADAEADANTSLFARLAKRREGKDLPSKVELPILADGWHYDAAISAFVAGPGTKAFDGTAAFDSNVIDAGAVGLGTLAAKDGAVIARLQSGFVRRYALAMGLGTVALLIFAVLRMAV